MVVFDTSDLGLAIALTAVSAVGFYLFAGLASQHAGKRVDTPLLRAMPSQLTPASRTRAGRRIAILMYGLFAAPFQVAALAMLAAPTSPITNRLLGLAEWVVAIAWLRHLVRLPAEDPQGRLTGGIARERDLQGTLPLMDYLRIAYANQIFLGPKGDDIDVVLVEIDADGWHSREVGLDGAGRVVHRFPDRRYREGAYGLYDAYPIDPDDDDVPITREEFEEAWTRDA